MTKVIPFFNRFGFISETKRFNYGIFVEIADLVSARPFDERMFIKVLQLREKLNSGAGRKRKYTLQNVLEESPETIRQAFACILK